MTVKERILFFLEKKQIVKEVFYKTTGMTASNFKGAALKSDLGVNKLSLIIREYPELQNYKNLIWLINGEGNLDLINEDKENLKDLGDLLTALYAKLTTQDKDLNFIQNQIKNLKNKLENDHEEYLKKILNNTNHLI